MPRHNLDAVMEHHGITIDQPPSRHARCAGVVAVLAQAARGSRAATNCSARSISPRCASTLPAALSPDLADDLPEGAGVYRFFGTRKRRGEALLYVGKANNLRERVLDHFRGGASDAKATKLAAQVRRVEWTETAGELGALLLEAREIRESQPVYNRQLRGGGERLTWLFGDGAEAPTLVPHRCRRPAQRQRVRHLSRGEGCAARARESLAREHKWCFKVLGLERGTGSCFGLQVGRCRGACVGKEPAALHLTRVKLALMPQRLQPWPHDGPMLIREGEGERVQFHVIDGWQHLGTFESGTDVAEVEEFQRLGRRARQESFDIDSYRILTRLLRDAKYRPQPLPRS